MKKIQRFLKKYCNAGSAGLLFQATTVQFTPLSGTQNGSLSGMLGSGGSLAGFLNAAFTMALSAGAILAVLRLAYAGWLYMGSDIWGNKEKAKEVIGGAILGLLLLIGIYIILFQINPCILNLNVLQEIQNASSASATCPAAS